MTKFFLLLPFNLMATAMDQMPECPKGGANLFQNAYAFYEQTVKSRMVRISNLDEIDRGIVRELQADGRRALREISRNLDVAEATIRLRLNRLVEEGILQIVAFADPTKLGSSQMALLLITVEPAAHSKLVGELKEWAEISYLSTTSGETDVCAQVVCADQTALWEICQKVRSLVGVSSVKLLNEIDVHKFRFMLPNGQTAA